MLITPQQAFEILYGGARGGGRELTQAKGGFSTTTNIQRTAPWLSESTLMICATGWTEPDTFTPASLRS